ncbi:hypothetical protein YTPLAS73_12710 [Nitrosarchaeum sp.]|nr:hypothetical protein YTPLAS73_12710 [Nitrosarchaeum sp.]
MKSNLLIIIGITLVGFTSSVYAQYIGDKISQENKGEYIGGSGMNHEQQLAQRLVNDQKNVFLFLPSVFHFLFYSVLLFGENIITNTEIKNKAR